MIRNKISLTKVFLLLFTLLLGSCGFHLRGDYLIAPELQTIEFKSVDKFGELSRIIKQHLSVNNITLVENSNLAIPQMRILQDTLKRRTLSVFPNGQVAEYELIYTVRYQIQFPDQEPLSYSFELNRDYQDDPNLALAKSRELSLMLKEMRQQAATRILTDMASIQP